MLYTSRLATSIIRRVRVFVARRGVTAVDARLVWCICILAISQIFPMAFGWMAANAETHPMSLDGTQISGKSWKFSWEKTCADDDDVVVATGFACCYCWLFFFYSFRLFSSSCSWVFGVCECVRVCVRIFVIINKLAYTTIDQFVATAANHFTHFRLCVRTFTHKRIRVETLRSIDEKHFFSKSFWCSLIGAINHNQFWCDL